VLRKEFYEFKKRGKNLSDKIEKILLIFGGSDPANLTATTLNELLDSCNDYKIDVIVGARFVYMSEINRILGSHPESKNNVKVYQDINNVAELMYKADLVFSSPGGSLFEALCVGTPVISVNQNERQKGWFEGYLPSLDKSEMGKINDIIAERSFIDPKSEFITKLETGEGKNELVQAIIGVKVK
jgi:spore coat polysaccharide biosynthesis predicted glycosyltransferase SpsG